MKNIYYTFIVIFLSNLYFGQTNLVPNPSFETAVTCPVSINQPITTANWSSYGGTVDYFNSCANVNKCGVSVPSNMAGYQTAATGSAYCGFVAYLAATSGPPNIREYLGTTLISPLVTGTKYYVSLKVCLAEGDCDGQTSDALDFNLACNKMGVKFITYNLPYVSAPPVFNSAHVFSNAVITDSTNWTTIKGTFIADSNYTQIVCGNFFDNANTSIISVGSPNKSAYYIIDDVIVSTDSLTTITGIVETNSKEFFSIYPNPSSDFVGLNSLSESTSQQFILTNSFGETVISQTIADQERIDISTIAEGIYFVHIISDDRKYYYKLIVKR